MGIGRYLDGRQAVIVRLLGNYKNALLEQDSYRSHLSEIFKYSYYYYAFIYNDNESPSNKLINSRKINQLPSLLNLAD